LKYFEIVMDLLEMEVDRKKYVEIATICEKNKDENFLFFHRHSFLFLAFLELVRGEIDLESFMVVWDISTKDKLISFSNSNDFLTLLDDSNFLEDLDWDYIVLDYWMLSFFGDLDSLSKKYKFSYFLS